MYKKNSRVQCEFAPFDLGFNGRLRKDNRWVIKGLLVPWDAFEIEYAKLFPSEEGRPAFSFRVALGTLIIKEELGISDDETVLQIQENPYLQWDLIKARLVGTSEAWIMIAIIVANLNQAYRAILPILLLYFALFYTEIGRRLVRQFRPWLFMKRQCFD